jgi:hypothetical protein
MKTRKLRIKPGHYYVLGRTPGISGFQQWGQLVECVVTAQKARLERLKVLREYVPNGQRQFRLCDGHFPEYQPRAPEEEALRWLDAHPWSEIVEVQSELSGLEGRRSDENP